MRSPEAMPLIVRWMPRAIRSSVSRLKKRGLLINERNGRATWYAPSDKMHEVFDEGAQILIVRKVGAFYRCIANPHPALM